MTWSAEQYAAFEEERTRPVRDLLAGVPVFDAETAIDLGCGPGNSTQVLAARFLNTLVAGIDSSQDMILAARKRLPTLDFEVTEIGAWIEKRGMPVRHRIGQCGAALGARSCGVIPGAVVPGPAAGGILAVQMPDNLGEPAQLLMREIAADGPWTRKLGARGEPRVALQSAGWYHQLLRSCCARVEVWRTTYYHALAGGKAIVEWFKGSGLRPFLDPLDTAERTAYLARYTAALKSAYPPLPDGSVLLPFPRLFVVARR